jgi:hypothetical protein
MSQVRILWIQVKCHETGLRSAHARFGSYAIGRSGRTWSRPSRLIVAGIGAPEPAGAELALLWLPPELTMQPPKCLPMTKTIMLQGEQQV